MIILLIGFLHLKLSERVALIITVVIATGLA